MIKRLLLDLDSTLYHPSVGMESDIIARMNAFVARLLDLPPEEAAEFRRVRAKSYGTTLEWLMAEYGYDDPDAYYAEVHPEGEEYMLRPDPALRATLEAIPLPKAIFTNAPAEHAERVIRRLGLDGVFDRVFDIRWNGNRGKPHAEAFRRVCSELGVEPRETVFVDDVPRYVAGFIACGGHGVLIDHDDRRPDADMVRVRSLAELGPLIRDGAFAWRQAGMFD
ncbi:MAG: HAD-IA family hydrolase [Spirochaetales bacterium]|nr:HAD-IA family hydrolase [Spirochaetales bacterium]